MGGGGIVYTNFIIFFKKEKNEMKKYMKHVLCLLLVAPLAIVFAACSGGGNNGGGNNNGNGTGNGNGTETMWQVLFDTQGGAPTPAVQNVEDNSYATVPTTSPQKSGYEFGGWSFAPDGAVTYSLGPICADTTICAVWQSIDTNERFDFILDPRVDGVSPSNYYMSISNGTVTSSNIPDISTVTAPKKFGHEFLGWFAATTGGAAITAFPAILTENTTLYAQWRKMSAVELYNGCFSYANVVNGNATAITNAVYFDGSGAASQSLADDVDFLGETNFALASMSGDFENITFAGATGSITATVVAVGFDYSEPIAITSSNIHNNAGKLTGIRVTRNGNTYHLGYKGTATQNITVRYGYGLENGQPQTVVITQTYKIGSQIIAPTEEQMARTNYRFMGFRDFNLGSLNSSPDFNFAPLVFEDTIIGAFYIMESFWTTFGEPDYYTIVCRTNNAAAPATGNKTYFTELKIAFTVGTNGAPNTFTLTNGHTAAQDTMFGSVAAGTTVTGTFDFSRTGTQIVFTPTAGNPVTLYWNPVSGNWAAFFKSEGMDLSVDLRLSTNALESSGNHYLIGAHTA
jgi:hypothetical protein